MLFWMRYSLRPKVGLAVFLESIADFLQFGIAFKLIKRVEGGGCGSLYRQIFFLQLLSIVR